MSDREALSLALAALHRVIEGAAASPSNPWAVVVAGRAAGAAQVLRRMRDEAAA